LTSCAGVSYDEHDASWGGASAPYQAGNPQLSIVQAPLMSIVKPSGLGRAALGFLITRKSHAWRALVGIACLALPACGPSETRQTGPPFAGIELEVAAVGNPAILEAVRVQSGEWERESGARLNFRTEPIEPSQAASAAVVIFPGSQLGALVDAEALAVIPESAVQPGGGILLGLPDETSEEPETPAPRDILDFADVAQPFREQVSKYGDDRVALPLGGTALVLVYRRDALASPEIQQFAKEKAIELQPPGTWEELDALARLLEGQDWSGDGRPDHGIALPLALDPEGLGCAIFLARAAALGQPLDQYSLLFDAETMKARLSAPPFLAALEGLVALKDAGPPGMPSFDAAAAREAFRRGQAALLIDRAENAGQWTDPAAPASVGVASLPGSPRVFDPVRETWITPSAVNKVGYLPAGGGWLAGISRSTTGPRREAALAFVKSLASAEVAQSLVSDPAFPMTSIRISHLTLGLPDPQAALGVDSREWGQALLETYASTRAVPSLRIPEAEGYLADLDQARAAVAAGELDAQKALESTSRLWDERTDRLGRDRQLWHYRRSLNRLSTTSAPPPRE
jgi:multiple sugar transport system substrate-binding protein